jgi:NAD(P)H-dependent FMN reductase
MADKILVLYGSYRSDRLGIRLADYIVAGLGARGMDAELIDAKAIHLPMLDRGLTISLRAEPPSRPRA